MTSQVETKEKVLQAAEALLGHPDTKVKTTARVVADYLRGLAAGVDEFARAVTPEGSAFARIEFKLSRFIASDRAYAFKRPIRVTVARDNGYFVAWSRFLVHGTGDTIEEALRDLMAEWQRHYERLVAEEDHLAPPLEKELATIRRLLAKEQDAS